MPFDETIEVNDGIVEVTLTGRLTSNDLPRGTNFFGRFVERCAEERSLMLLIDLSGISLVIDQGDRMKAGLDASEFKDTGLRLALVLRREQISAERFFETIASARGMLAIATDSRDKAREWLRSDIP